MKNSVQISSTKHNVQPIGYEKVYRGKLYIKVDNRNNHHGNNFAKNPNWKLKSHYIWEKSNGPVPADHRIIHLDGNVMNCDLSNLMCLSRAGYMEAVQNDWPLSDRRFADAIQKRDRAMTIAKGAVE